MISQYFGCSITVQLYKLPRFPDNCYFNDFNTMLFGLDNVSWPWHCYLAL